MNKRNTETIMKDYHINIFHSDEDEGYIADIPDLSQCSAFGEPPTEALAEVLRTKDAWLEAAKENGRSIPQPRYNPVFNQTGNLPLQRYPDQIS